jgi:glycosyltransferase involved in cell wall biosynthesis
MPNFTHYAAYLVKKKFGNEIKWYASFSDPIKNNPYIEDMKNNKLFSKNRILYFIQKKFYYKKKYQDLALKYADKLIFINEELRDFFIEGNEDLLKKSIIVPLNYVEEWDVYNDLIKYTPKFNNNSKINFIHFGNIYGLRKIDYFLEALLELRNEIPNLEEKIQFIQYGEVEKNQLEKIKCYKLGELVKINNKINYNDCIQKMKYEADVLVVFDTILDEGKIQPFLPSKILDYLLIRKPIFSITTRKSPLYSLINQKHICVTYDVKQIKKGIIKQINNIKVIENNYEMYENKKIIEETATKHGKKSSSNGHWIYPGTKLLIPDID